MNEIVLEMHDIAKSFGGVQALKGINFKLIKGEIHALLGENGAGKSTLMKVLAGIHEPDSGEIFINGEPARIDSVQDAYDLGIGIIHQEIMMVPELSIAENIFLGREPLTKSGLIDKAKMIEISQKSIERLGLELDVSKPVGELTIAQQQLVEIAKAVTFEIKMLVMDEPTSSLTGSDIRLLFKTMNRLIDQGVSIIYISHRFEELFEITDQITVIRDGLYIDTVKTKDTNSEELVKLMVGRDIEKLYTRTPDTIRDKEVLRVENISKEGMFENVSFNLYSGEIIGFSGLVGSGRTELLEAIFGATRIDSGRVFINNTSVDIKSTEDAISAGLGMVTEDRKTQGLLLNQSVGFNLTLANIPNLLKNKFIEDEEKKIKVVEKYFNELKIKASSPSTEVNTLSGGNQQKVVIAKWLATNPQILILDEPTRGVDVGAKSEIYSIIDELSKEGIGIVLISSDLPEILNMADRTYVMREGKLVAEVPKEKMTQETIMNHATGGETL